MLLTRLKSSRPPATALDDSLLHALALVTKRVVDRSLRSGIRAIPEVLLPRIGGQLMHTACRILTIGSLLLAGLAGPTSQADEGRAHSPRQYYGSWHKPPRGNYFYRGYYFKPHAGYSGYRHHYVVLFADRPRHCYFYNPYTKQYWGRCSTFHEGKAEYSHLPPAAQRGKIAEIPETAFPPPGELPAIPDSKDGANLDLFPDDLPEDFGAP